MPSGSSGPSVGALAITLDSVTLSSGGSLPVYGALSVTLSGVTLSAAGTVPILGALSATLVGVSLAGGGSVVTLAPKLKIAGTDRSDKTKTNSVRIRRSMNDRSSMTAELTERAGTYRPAIGNVVTVEYLGRKRFAGYIESIREQAVPGNSAGITYAIACTDYTRLLDWRLYAGSFENQSFYDIVYTIWSAKLQSDGVTLGAIPNPGPTITNRIQDGLRPIAEWFRKLSTETGYLFRINEDKELDFGPLATSPANPAPFSLIFGSLNWRDLEVNRTLGDYRNVQWVRTEYTVTADLTITFTGDGSTRDFFQLDGPFSGIPTVTVNGVPKTVGRLGFDLSGYDWYVDYEGWGLHRYPDQSAPAPGDSIVMTYRVRFRNYTVEEDATEIAARAVIQGDSGRIEAISEDRYIDTPAALTSRANALLRQFGQIPITVDVTFDSEIEPDSDYLEPGQMMAIDLTDGRSDVDDDFLVESMESAWRPTSPDTWEHRVRLTNREPYGQPSGSVIEKLAEAVRIGPDIGTVAAESPVEPDIPKDWSATIVDDRATLVSGSDLANHRPVDVEDGYKVELDNWYATLKAPPAASFAFRVQRSTDNGSSWSPVFTGTFSAGARVISGSSFTITHLYNGERLRYDVTSGDNGATVLTVVINGREVADLSPA